MLDSFKRISVYFTKYLFIQRKLFVKHQIIKSTENLVETTRTFVDFT